MLLRAVKTALLFFVIGLLLASLWLSYSFLGPQDLPAEDILYNLEKGKALRSVACDLEKKGLIRDDISFLVGYRLFYFPEKIKAGEYFFSGSVTAKKALDSFTGGKVYLHPTSIPEGLTGREIAELILPLSRDGPDEFIRAFRDTRAVSSWDHKAEDLEGYLFPETYHFPRGISAVQAVDNMVDQFRSAFNDAWKARAGLMRMTVRDTVILASLIEKETRLTEEKKLVSAVFHNRLKRGMKLDCDPTIIYAIKQKGIFEGRLRTKDLKLDTPYNTYLYAGLPPGPICNPGRESLEAALYPAAEDFLYFVSRNDGSHHFSRTYAEHLSAVRKYQKNSR